MTVLIIIIFITVVVVVNMTTSPDSLNKMCQIAPWAEYVTYSF